jgi:hypothetical protein
VTALCSFKLELSDCKKNGISKIGLFITAPWSGKYGLDGGAHSTEHAPPALLTISSKSYSWNVLNPKPETRNLTLNLNLNLNVNLNPNPKPQTLTLNPNFKPPGLRVVSTVSTAALIQ